MINFNGAYKFNTSAYENRFRSCFIKVKLFDGSNNQLDKKEFFEYFTRNKQTEIVGSDLDFSARVEAEIIVVDSDSTVLYSRVFDNTLEYITIDTADYSYLYDQFDEVIGINKDSFLEAFPLISRLIPEITVCLDIDPSSNKNFLVYGIISPSYEMNLQSDFRDFNFITAFPRRKATFFNSSVKHYSFIGQEDLIEINMTSRLVVGRILNPPENRYERLYNQTLFFVEGNNYIFPFLYYIGYGTWYCQPQHKDDIAFEYQTAPYATSSMVHKYPNTKISPTVGLPNNNFDDPEIPIVAYDIDFDKTYSEPMLLTPLSRDIVASNPIYNPLIKDSKTGELIFAENTIPDSRFKPPGDIRIWVNNNSKILNPFHPDYQKGYIERFSTTYGNSNMSEYYPLSGCFLYNSDYYEFFASYKALPVPEKQVTVTVKKNKYFPFLFEGEQKEYELKVTFPPEYMQALKKMSPNNDTNIDFYQGATLYSEDTKTYWKFCNAIVLPR